jgi:hypothetical protein
MTKIVKKVHRRPDCGEEDAEDDSKGNEHDDDWVGDSKMLRLSVPTTHTNL